MRSNVGKVTGISFLVLSVVGFVMVSFSTALKVSMATTETRLVEASDSSGSSPVSAAVNMLRLGGCTPRKSELPPTGNDDADNLSIDSCMTVT